MISAIIFDLDGVLADTEHLHWSAFADVFETRGWTLSEAAYTERYLGLDDRGVIGAYAADHRIPMDASELDRIVCAKSAAFARLLAANDVLYPAASACVRALAARYPLGISSGALHAEIVAILATGRLLPCFAAIVGADDVRDPKPSPESYLEAARLLGVAAADCMAVEDSRWGLTAARAAGMKTVALPTTSPPHMLAAADRILGSLAELTPELVDRFGRPS